MQEIHRDSCSSNPPVVTGICDPNKPRAWHHCKISNVSNLIKKTDYNTKINETGNRITYHDHDKYITTPEFNKLTSENFAGRLKQANLANKSDIANFVKN